MSLSMWIAMCMKPLNIFIILLAVFVGVCLNSNHKKLKSILKDAQAVYKETKSSSYINNAGSLGFSYNRELDVESMDKTREAYNDASNTYQSLVQWISIFPLLGLLGTVAGLIPGLQAVQGGDMTVLYNSLSGALTSTFLGLVASIILKSCVALGPSKIIYAIESSLIENDRKYNLRLGVQSLEDHKELD